MGRTLLFLACLLTTAWLPMGSTGALAQSCDGGGDCDDGNQCTQNLCVAGTCSFPLRPPGSACSDDGNPCTYDQCLPGESGVTCQHPLVAFGSPCPDDGDECTFDECQLTDSGMACVHQIVPPGSPCNDDGDPCTYDRCHFTDSSGFACTHPIVPPGSTCPDDGNECTTDLCLFGDTGMACQHQLQPLGSPCPDDGNQCTNDRCLPGTGGGVTCLHQMRSPGSVCDDGSPCTEIDACNFQAECVAISPPRICRSAAKASVVIKNPDGSDRDLIDYKWIRGETTDLAELGDPTVSTDYTLCVFDGGMRLAVSADVPAGGECGDASCWRPKSKGYRYDDELGLADGVGKIRLSSGAAERSSVHVRGRGRFLDLPTLPLAGAVLVQVVNDETGVCFGTQFSSPSASTAKKFIAKTP